jgi:hypothetical protein
MKVLYAGDSMCDEPTLKRLLLVADEICFTDRPSVTFGQWGTIGQDSPIRQIMQPPGLAVSLSAHKPPSGPAEQLYLPYIEADLSNPQFVEVFWDGLKSDEVFASKFLQLGAKYGDGRTGAEVRAVLLGDSAITKIAPTLSIDGRHLFDVGSPSGRAATLKALLAGASIQVTSALVVADETGASPISNDPYMTKLLALRSANAHYVKDPAGLSPYLGVEFLKAVIPDEALQRLSLGEIMKYREDSKDLYTAWAADLNRVAARLDESDISKASEIAPRLIVEELAPKILTYRQEMIGVRDKLFGDIAKGTAKWNFPAVMLAYVTGGLGQALVAFATMAVPTIAPNLIDYIRERRAIERKNSASYLIGLAPRSEADGR